MVDLCYAISSVITSNDNSILITSPGWAGAAAFTKTASIFFPHVGSAFPAQTGASTCSIVNYHPYGLNPPGESYGNAPTWLTDIISTASYSGNGWAGFGLSEWLAAMSSAGLSSYPLWLTETGVDGTGSSAADLAWYASTPAFRYAWMAQWFMTCAVFGVKVVCPWHWEETSTTQGNSGNWQTDTQGVQEDGPQRCCEQNGRENYNQRLLQSGTDQFTFEL